MLSHKRLTELLDYDPVTGIFIRKISISNRTKVGEVAGSISKGYRQITVDGIRYEAHRLAWFFHYGHWPNGIVDHEDHDGLNNRIKNLRDTGKQGNSANSLRNQNNRSGYKGVSPFRKSFRATIRVNGRLQHLGCFSDPKDAAAAYDKAAVQNFGQFALTNKSMGYI